MNLKSKVIKHWKENLEKATNQELPALGRHYCVYCKVYSNPTECGGCPIKAKTGKNYCTGTPYYRVAFEAEKIKRYQLDGVSDYIIWEKLITAIEKEIEFLQSLQEDIEETSNESKE